MTISFWHYPYIWGLSTHMRTFVFELFLVSPLSVSRPTRSFPSSLLAHALTCPYSVSLPPPLLYCTRCRAYARAVIRPSPSPFAYLPGCVSVFACQGARHHCPSPLFSYSCSHPSPPFAPILPLIPSRTRYPCPPYQHLCHLFPWSVYLSLRWSVCIVDERQGCGMTPRRHHVVQATTMCIIY